MNEGVSMKELMNFVHQHGFFEGDYGIHFTTNGMIGRSIDPVNLCNQTPP